MKQQEIVNGTQKEDGFMRPIKSGDEKELPDPRLGIVTASKNEKGKYFSDVGRK